ncbi:MAG: hypothetical protein OXD43_12495 [Bacteroidetes bacterium]|nr:hypothetical protein [Bacteroidota bacterium]
MRWFPAVVIFLCVAASAFAQNRTGLCPSNLDVAAGESRMIDCGLDAYSLEYEWISPDPSWLVYLSDVTVASPRFNAPAGISTSQRFTYRRLSLDQDGNVVDRKLLSITVNPVASPVGCNHGSRQDCLSLENTDQILLDDRYAPGSFDLSTESRAPFLDCEPRVTVGSGTMAEIRCTGLNPSGEQLTYRAEFDWSPFSETRILVDGAFDYFVRVPLIDEPAAVRMLEISASVPGKDMQVSQSVEVHIVNRNPVMMCEDLIVEEAVEAAFPCSVTPDRNIEYQFISDPPLVQRGRYDHWPTFLVPEVDRDRSVPVIVRAFEAGSDQVVEADFMVRIRNTSGPMDFTIECTPAQTEVYEGTPDVVVTCRESDAQTRLTWTLQADGANDPYDRINFEEFPTDGKITFLVPEDVMKDEIYNYKVIAVNTDDEQARADFSVTVLDTPQITVGCTDAFARTGDPPLQLSCMASNSTELLLEYEWNWDPTTRLSDPSIGTPLFTVPTNDEQPELSAEYEYEVTASADNPDIPNLASASASLTVTVEKFFGKLELGCISPIEVYEGDPAIPIDCSVQGFDPAVTDPISWTWTPLDGLSLEEGELIFQTPASISTDPTIYRYDIQIDAPYHDPSDVEQVEVRVRERPVLSLECQDLTVTVGMPPQSIQCEVSHDQGDAELNYVWQWDPTTRLSDISTGTPLFATPSRQRLYSQVHTYSVTVQAEYANPVETMVSVTVINPAVGPPEEISISTSELDLGVVGPRGQVWLDPGTEQVSGLVYEGSRTHAGRMVIRAQDEVTVSMEQLPSAVLRHVGLPGELEISRELTLTPQWAYSESCVEFAANTQAGQTVQTSLQPGDCHVIRIGGTVELKGVKPGDYSGEVVVVVTIDEIDQLYSIPVVLTVEAERQVVVLGPEGVSIRPVSATTEELQWAESISIQPQVAVLGPNTPSGTFTVANPSVHSMEIEVSTEFGYRETRETDPFSVPATGELGDLAELVFVHPNVVVLLPGETKQVRYAVAEHEFRRMEDRGYAALFNFTVTSRAYIEQRRAPVAEQSARVTFQALGVYIPGQGPEQLRATVESRTEQAAIVLIETDTSPFYGDVVVKDDAGNELGRSEVLVYTRSRVHVDWNANPSGGLTLQFVPSHLDHIKPNDVFIPAND